MTSYIDCETAASIMQCTPVQVQRLIKAGKLRAFKPVKEYLIDPADLESFIRTTTTKKEEPEKEE